MHRRSDTRSTDHQPRRSTRWGRGLGVALATLALATSGLVAVSTASEAAPKPPRLAIKKTKKADGAYLGARTVGSQLGYRITPRAKPGGNRFKRVRVQNRVKGASRAASAQAAWILSEFGGDSDPAVAAAADVAILHLLKRGKWALNTRYTRKRTDQTGQGAKVREYATALVGFARSTAGPYRLSLRVVPRTPGTGADLMVTVIPTAGPSKAWLPSEVPVTVTYAGRRVTETIPVGSATSITLSSVPGAHRVNASVRVPEDRLFVRQPRSRKRSAVALVGRTRVIAGSVPGPTNGNLSVQFEQPTYNSVGGGIRARVEMWGGRGTRTVTSALHGPSTHASAGCTGTPAWTGTQTTTADRISLPETHKTSVSGYYWWKVTVRDATGSVTRCGPRSSAYVQVRSINEAHMLSPRINTQFGPTYTITGFDRVAQQPVTTTFHGPFDTSSAARSCTGRVKASFRYTVSRQTTLAPRTSHPTSGWFGVVTNVPDTPFFNGFTGVCQPVAVNRPLHVAQTAGSAATVKVGKAFGPTVKVTGFDRKEAHTVSTTLHGPFEKREYATCQYVIKRAVNRTISGNTTSSPRFSIGSTKNVGWYVIRTKVSGTSLLTGHTSTCSGAYRVVKP